MISACDLTDLAQKCCEPGRRDIEMLAALDTRKFDRGELAAALLVMTDKPALALEARGHGMIDHGADQPQVFRIGSGRACAPLR